MGDKIRVEGEMWLGKLKTGDSIAYFCGARLNMTGVVYNRCEMVRPGRVFEGVKNILLWRMTWEGRSVEV